MGREFIQADTTALVYYRFGAGASGKPHDCRTSGHSRTFSRYRNESNKQSEDYVMKKAFPPVVNMEARVLILGSMPGEASLEAGEYYAFARNAFWRIMDELIGTTAEMPYAQRLELLQQAGIALWDVIDSCERNGSLDSAIIQATLVANDFEIFLEQWPNIKTICFNGKSVERLFRTHVIKKQRIREGLRMFALPSTSPANAQYTFEQKLTMWNTILRGGRMAATAG